MSELSTKNIGTTANLKPNYWIVLKDLFYGIMLPSGNDAAHLLAEVFGYLLLTYSLEEKHNLAFLREIDLTTHNASPYMAEFIKAMNCKADELGLQQTRFSNPHGLQNGMNLSTAKDVIALSRYVSKNETFRKIMNTEKYHCYNHNG